MATPNRENCLANIKTTLEGITVANGYNYNMDTVVRDPDGPFFDLLDTSIDDDAMAFIEDADSGHALEAHNAASGSGSALWLGSMNVFVTVAVRYQTDAVNPKSRTGTLPSTVRSYIIQDVLKAMLTTHTRGGYARNTFIENEGPVIDPDIEELSGWISHEFHFTVIYEYDESTGVA